MTTDDDERKLSKHAKALAKRGAAKGGKARAEILTPEERSEIARRAVKTRWAREKGIPLSGEDDQQGESVLRQVSPGPDTLLVGRGVDKRISLFKGDVQFGDITVPCHVLNDGSRVIAQREVIKALTGQERPSGSITRIIGTPNLSPFINADDIAKKVLQYELSGPGHQMSAYGYEATLLIEVCEAFLKARDAGVLSDGQKNMARVAETILRACAKVGIIALIDEATGYQKVRAENALRLKLQAFIAEDMQEWARMFPEEFFLELARLENVRYSPRSRPLRWGKYVMAFVYYAVDRDVAKELKERTPHPHYRQNLHQWLRDFGKERVTAQLYQVLGVMKTCRDMDEFRQKFGFVFKKEPYQLTFFDLMDSLGSN